MANAKPKPRAMRSRRSGVKKAEVVRKNRQILQKYITKAEREK